jgi:hypothetical protein
MHLMPRDSRLRGNDGYCCHPYGRKRIVMIPESCAFMGLTFL